MLQHTAIERSTIAKGKFWTYRNEKTKFLKFRQGQNFPLTGKRKLYGKTEKSDKLGVGPQFITFFN